MVRKAYGPGSSSSASGRRPVGDRRRVDPWAGYPAVRPRASGQSSSRASSRAAGRAPVGPVGLPRQSGWLTAKRHAGAVQQQPAAAPDPTAALPGQTVQTGLSGQVWPQPVPGPALPVFSPAAAAAVADAVASAGQGAPAPAPVVRRPGQGLEVAAAWGWRHRWPLTPVAAAAVVVAGSAGAPGSTGAVLAGAAAGMAWWARSAREVRGRMWLSVRERSLAAGWMGAASVLAGAAALGVPVSAVAALTVAGTAPAGVMWARSRRVCPTDDTDIDVVPVGPVLSQRAAAIVAAWPSTIGLDGPDKLTGSHVVADSMSEPAPGTYAFAVELAPHVHALDAVGETVTRALERTMRMGIGTVEVRADRDDAARILVTLQPARDLEHEAAPWPPPGVAACDLLDLERGSFSLAVERGGKAIESHLWNEDGVEHFLIAGATGGGKSVTTSTKLLPGPLARREVVVYVDGGAGSSNGAVVGACDWVATEKEEWIEAIRAVWRILKARKTSRAKLGLSRWRGRDEQIPVVTLVLEEAATLLGELAKERSAGGDPKRTLVDDVLEILREGRKLGVRIGQITQDPMGEDCWGGRKGRGLIAGGGMVVAHRPNDAVAARMVAGGKAIDLLALPATGGFVGIIRRGQVLTECARVRYAAEHLVYAALDGFVPRQLEGMDAAVAGAAYAARTRGHVAAAQIAANRAAEAAAKADGQTATEVVDIDALSALLASPDLTNSSSQAAGQLRGDDEDVPALNTTAAAAAAEAETNRAAVLDQITAHGPLTRGEIVTATGLGRTTVGRALTHWATAGRITKTGDTWTTHPINRPGR